MDRFLPVGYELHLNGRAGKYIITDIVGKGASTVAYYADYYCNDGNSSKHIIKEFNPSYISFRRTESGEMKFDTCDENRVENAKERFLSGCYNQIKIRNQIATMNQTPPIEGPFYANNTIYTDVIAYNGATYDAAYKNLSLCDRIKVCLSVAKLVKCYHDAGYLCLDIKPENIFVIPETKELLYFIDFDSVCTKQEIAFGNSISYTKQWAAPEQLTPYAMDEISEATDVYAIGELVFWSVFGRHSTIEEHRGFSVYPFEDTRYDVQNVLMDFFRCTLRTSVNSRCNVMTDVIIKIEKIVDILSEKEYVVSHKLSKQNCIGRETIISEISDSLKINSTLFVTGVGGIGKSTVVKQFFFQNSSMYDIALYLEYDGNIKSTFTNQININTFARNYEESIDEYYDRMLARLQSISNNKKVLIIIDNFSGKISKELSRLLDCQWNIVIVTRTNPLKCNFRIVEIKAITDIKHLYQIFENNLESKVNDEEHIFVNKIIKKIDSHTLVLELIAKQISNSRISIAEAAELVELKGFSNISSEKIDYIKDGEEYYDTISNIILALFDISNLSSECQTILKMISLFDVTGINIGMLCTLMGLESQDGFNQLNREGWAYIEESQVKLHPVIAETIATTAWTDECHKAALRITRSLFEFIKLEDKKEDVPLKMVKLYEFMKKYGNEKIITKIFNQDDPVESVAYKRMLRNDAREPTDLDKLNDYVALSEKFLNNIQNISDLNSNDLYVNLLYCTVMAMPSYREDYILEKAKSLLNDNPYNNGNTILKLYDRIVWIYTERGDFDSAYNEICNAKKFIKRHRKNEYKALYHEILATYYDAKLSGSYNVQTEEEKQILNQLIASINKSIRYISCSKNVYKNTYLAKFLLSKANVLMRSSPAKEVEIEKLHKKVHKLIIKHTLKYSEVRCDYWMSLAWYYTLIKPDYICVMKCIEYSWEIAKHICRTPLDEIDKIVIPLANMCCELEYYDKAEKWLSVGIEMCAEFKDILPYVRKRINLMRYTLEVYYYSSDFEKCRSMIAAIEKENQQYSKFGVSVEIPKDIYEQVYLKQ